MFERWARNRKVNDEIPICHFGTINWKLRSHLYRSEPGQIMSIGTRLKAERLRLGLSQSEIGKIGGVEVNAQGRYENGIRHPRADYLAEVAKAGIDVLFVITGTRTQNGSADSLKAAEALDSATECLEKAKELIH